MNASRPLRTDGEVAGLIRKSDVRYPDDCLAPEARAAYEQELIQTRMAELVSDAQRDGVVITRWYIDLDVSGRAAYEYKREGLQQLLTDARAGLVRILYARELSRIYRDTVKSIVFKGEMQKLGVDVRARDLIRSEDSATETLVQTIQFAVDQFQSERTGIQIRSRNLQAFLADQWPGLARDMWGLRYNPQAKHFDFDPVGAILIQRLMEILIAERGNAYRVALALNTQLLAGEPEAIPTPGGVGAMWDAKDVLRLAKSPFYRRHGKYAGQTRYQPDLIPEVVPLELVLEVDRVLGQRSETVGGRRKRGGREDYTYGPLMRCGDCGGRMRTIRFLKMREAGNPEWLYWVCRQGADSRILCPHSWSFTQVRLDRLVGLGLQQAMAAVQTEPPLSTSKTRNSKSNTQRPKSNTQRPNSQQRQKGDLAASLSQIDTQIERTMRLYTSGVTADFDWVQGEVKRLEAQKQLMQQQEAQEVQESPKLLVQMSLAQWEDLRHNILLHWQPGPTAPLETDKIDFLLSLGVSLSVRTQPRSLPATSRLKSRRKSGLSGGPLHLKMEIERLGMTGEQAILIAETEQQWYQGYIASRSRGSKEEDKKEEDKEESGK